MVIINEDGEDAELEAFADKAIEDKMRELYVLAVVLSTIVTRN